MVMFDANVGASVALDIPAWLAATSAGQPGGVASGITTTGTDGQVFSLSGLRWLCIVRNTSGYPQAVIRDLSAVGTAVTLLSSNVTIINVQRMRANTNRFLVLCNNDVYLLDCGASGTTITVTQVSTDAGDAAKGEAFTQGVTSVIPAADDSHFVICNEFDNAGTRSFVSALFTITYSGTPAATYVTRDVDATGSAAAIGAAFSGWGATSGVGFCAGINTTDTTTIRFNKITFTASTVSNALTDITISTAIVSVTGVAWNSINYPEDDVTAICYTGGSSASQSAVIGYSGTPALVSNPTPGGNTVSHFSYGRTLEATAGYRVDGIGSSTMGVRFAPLFSSGSLFQTAGLATGLTTAGDFGADFDSTGNYVCVQGKTSTNTGQTWVFQNTNI